MSTFTITIQLDQQGRQYFVSNGIQVCVQRSFETGGSSVVWVAFQPFQNNQVTWEEQFEVYVSNTQLQQGAVIEVSDQTPATEGDSYVYADGSFRSAAGSPGSINVKNAGSTGLTAGLAMQAEVNDKAAGGPFVAVELLAQFQASFTPSQKVQIYGAAGVQAGQYEPIPSDALDLDLSSPDLVVHWDDDQQRFVAGPLG